MTVADSYTCDACGDEFEKGWSDDEADRELAVTFPGAEKAQCAIVCDDCYQRLMACVSVAMSGPAGNA